MSQTRIEQLINEIYDFVEGCKSASFSSSKIVVQKDQLLDLVDELKRRTPDEIKRYQRIIANRDSIIAQAEEKARQIEEEAHEKAKLLIDETEIMQQAYAQANELIQSARYESDKLRRETQEAADTIRTGALAYTNDILSEVSGLLSAAYQETKDNSERLVESLKTKLDIINENQKEVVDQLNDEINDGNSSMNSDNSGNEDEFNFSEETFLNGVQ